jgi:hypothetical protein
MQIFIKLILLIFLSISIVPTQTFSSDNKKIIKNLKKKIKVLKKLKKSISKIEERYKKSFKKENKY